MTKEDELKHEYPLHWAVFRDDYEELLELLEELSEPTSIDKVDVRGRTPLMLAVTLGHVRCARALLEKGADASCQNADMWSLSHEAISLGEPSLLRLILQYRDYQRAVRTSDAMQRLLTLLKETDDFYAEMSWEFSSWLPLVSKWCPSDTYKIYKRASDVRIDTTLVGFDSSTNWKRGNQSFIFRFADDDRAQLLVLDHDRRTATKQTMDSHVGEDLGDFDPPEEAVASRLTSPVDTTYVDIDKIGFERSKAGGLLSWITSSDRTEEIDGYNCKVFNASNVEIVTKTRAEHLLEEDKERFKQEESGSPLHKVLRLLEKREECTSEMKHTGGDVYCGLTPAQYLDCNYDMTDRDIGRPKEVTRKSSSFKATLWLCDNYPLDLQDQILPIIDLMAVNNTHFARLKNFIQLQLPAGFPIKIEIPLFHVVSARITFANVNKPGRYVTPSTERDNAVVIAAEAFEVPEHYRFLDSGPYTLDVLDERAEGVANGHIRSRRYIPDDELYLQFALEQSAREAAGMPSGAAENGPYAMPIYDPSMSDMDPELAYAIAESLRSLRAEAAESSAAAAAATATDDASQGEDDLSIALRLSRLEEEKRLQEQREQDDELNRVLQLSLVDK